MPSRPGAISVGEIDDDESSDESTVATVAVAPAPTPETAARLEVLLKSFSTLTKQANIDREFAPIFADLTVRVGKLHRMLGNFDDAQTYFADGIEKYEAIVDENSDISTIIGLASAYNEQGDVIALTRHPLAAYSTYQQALDLFATHEEKLGDSPRATYERARTLFLMSMEYKPGPGQMGGGRRQGNGPPGTAKTQDWVLEFVAETPRELDPLTGWTGSRDTQAQVTLHFATREEAEDYAKSKGVDVIVLRPQNRKPNLRPGGYGENFATNRRGAWTH